MPGHFPSIDPDSLAKLRELVKSMHQGNGRTLPMEDLVKLAGDVGLGAGITVDLEASRELGQPMVVLRTAAAPKHAACLERLSKREREVAALVANGLSNKEIAKQLFISLATVKDHVHNILTTSGLANRTAIAAAYRGHDTSSDATA